MGPVSRAAASAHPRQGEVWWVNLDPTVGQEIKKRRPCLIVSPDDMNAHLSTVIAAPITSTLRAWPTRVEIRLQRRRSSVALDQIRTLDNSRLVERIARVDSAAALSVLREMFA